jgi:hypothetical protein
MPEKMLILDYDMAETLKALISAGDKLSSQMEDTITGCSLKEEWREAKELILFEME